MIFTTTSLPSCNVPRCAWPMLAAPSGTASSVLKTVCHGAPSSASITSRTVANGSLGASSWSVAMLSVYSRAKKSVRVLPIWPILM